MVKWIKRLIRIFYLKRCKIIVEAQQTDKVMMIVRVLYKGQVVETHSMCYNKDFATDLEIRKYVHDRLVEA
jgi:hypothetical protein